MALWAPLEPEDVVPPLINYIHSFAVVPKFYGVDFAGREKNLSRIPHTQVMQPPHVRRRYQRREVAVFRAPQRYPAQVLPKWSVYRLDETLVPGSARETQPDGETRTRDGNAEFHKVACQSHGRRGARMVEGLADAPMQEAVRWAGGNGGGFKTSRGQWVSRDDVAASTPVQRVTKPRMRQSPARAERVETPEPRLTEAGQSRVIGVYGLNASQDSMEGYLGDRE
ncbi:hypothetical protein B0H14DRAFT_2582852 [Mycena olivaceomarginata]|nr:hypothetical protein B0H14DRAFT_2582852 [Mycena olivaceomarginata]